MAIQNLSWQNPQNVTAEPFVCWNCGSKVASDKGLQSQGLAARLFLCSNCGCPTFRAQDGAHYPAAPPGNPVPNIPDDNLRQIYEEARRAVAAGAPTAAAMACRKILMNIAVHKGAPEGKRFVEYVNWLKDHHYIPPGGEGWVEHLKDRGNEANHEIKIFQQEDAIKLMTFAEMLLKFIYELPALVPPKIATAEAPDTSGE